MYRLTWRLPLAGLVAFSHLQFSQIRGRQPYLIVRNILYVIRRKKHREVNLTDKRKFWSKLSKWDDRVEREWIQWIELIAGLSALILLTLSLLAVWDGKSP